MRAFFECVWKNCTRVRAFFLFLMRFSRAFKAITSELYHSGTHPLRFNVRIHSIGTTNTWHCCLLSTTSNLIKLSILKLTRLRCLPAIEKQVVVERNRQSWEFLLTAVHQKLINL